MPDAADPAMPASTRGRRPGRRVADTHYAAAREELSRLLVELADEGRDRLPAEDQLSATLGFSRPTIRSALLGLEKEGKIQRLHGIGTLINRYALRMKANLAEEKPFLDVIGELGYVPTVDILGIDERALPGSVAERLGIAGGAHGCLIRRLFRASGHPAVYSQDFVPMSFLTAELGTVTAERSTFAFIERWTEHEVRYSVTDIMAAKVEDAVARALILDAGDVVLKLDLLHITERDERIGVTHAYINDGVLRFGIVRSASLV